MELKRETEMYWNHMTEKNESECAEKGAAGYGNPERWYIKMGFAGFNSPANNRNGYNSKAAAEKACSQYQKR